MRRAADVSCLAAHFSFWVQQTLAVGVEGAQRADAQQSRGFVGVQFRAGVHFADGASTPCPVVQRTARTEDAFGLCLHFASICHRGFALEKLRLKPAATFHIPCVFEHSPRPFAMAQGDRNEMLHFVRHDSLSALHVRREEAYFPAHHQGYNGNGG